MSQTTAILSLNEPAPDPPARVPAGRPWHLLIGGALTAWFAFRAGGFFPGTVGIAAVGLAVVLVLRMTLARAPWAGWSPLAAVIAGAGAAYGCWMLASVVWSDAPGRAVPDFNRALLYVLAFGVMAMVPRRPGDLGVFLRWVLAAIVAAAVAGLATRLLPDVFPWVSGLEPARLGYPLTYWNAMSVFCALGVVLALSAASDRDAPAWLRVLAGAALPVLAVAGYFPLSRGGILTAIVGCLALVALARPPRMLVTLLTAGPPTVVAVVAAYSAPTLATAKYFEGAGPAEGHRIALILAACCAAAAIARLVALGLDARVDARLAGRVRARTLAAVAVAGVLVVAGAGVALDVPHVLRTQYDGFVKGNVVDPGADKRQRLTAAGNNGRLATWRVGRDAFESQPLHGTGAGTYELAWQRERPGRLKVIDGHSLYLETLAELGVVGLVLLAIALGGILLGLARGLRRPDRHAHAAVLAAALALLLHAAIDWDWEMPALFAWLFAAGGLACARPPGDGGAAHVPRRLTRVVAGLACLVLAVTPALTALSHASLGRALTAFDRGDCGTAIDASLDSIDTLSLGPEAHEVVAYCDMRAGEWSLALRAMEAARARDPHSWRYAYGLAIAQAFAGRDPRPAIAEARRLNPLASEASSLAKAFARGSTPREWRRAAAKAQLPS
jgi:hypothetical protein